MSDENEMMIEQDEMVDDGMGPATPADYLHLSDEELRKECAKAREPKIIGIRDWPKSLSERQRYCLAVWAAKRDDREMQRSLACSPAGS